ncbi:MAG TPA: cytochrome c biogenesis protein CcdA [Candidatus Deferrimicrobiaceae bacterium]
MVGHFVSLLQGSAGRPVGFFFALVLGTVSAAASACCTLPAMGILIGYSGARQEKDRRTAAISALSFMAGTILSLMIIGALAGLFGQVAQNSLGGYWKPFAGIVAIVFGLATLKLLPFDLSPAFLGNSAKGSGKLGTATGGLLLGGGLAACSLPCNPGIFIVIGAAVLQGQVLWGALMLAMFAVGFSLPMGAVLLGVSLGKTALPDRNAETAIRRISGGILLAAGFYLLASS